MKPMNPIPPQQPKNLAMHKFCQGKQPPTGTKNLLGLGPNTVSSNLKKNLNEGLH
jgi:hypothetical protein